MRKLTKFHVRLLLEALNDRELPGNLLSAILASDFLPTDHRQLSLVPPSLTPFSRLLLATAATETESSESILPARPASTSGNTSSPVTLTTDTAFTQFGDFRSDQLVSSGLDSHASSQTATGMTSHRATDDAGLAFSTGVSGAKLDTNQNPPVVIGNERAIGFVLPNGGSELDALTNAVSQSNKVSGNRSTQRLRSEGETVIHLDVPINANDDNGSPIVDYIPTIYDFNASYSDYPANNKIDPDLVFMDLIDETPPPYPYNRYKKSVIDHTLTVTQPVPGQGGHIRLWTSTSKEHEYTVFNTPTSENQNYISPGDSFPGIYLEGTEPSLVDDEVTVHLDINWGLYQGATQVGTWTSHYRTVKATVTPRIQSLSIVPNEPNTYPHFGSNNSAPPWDSNILNGLFYRVTISTSLWGSLSRAGTEYVQNLTGTSGLVDGDHVFRIVIPNTVNNSSEFWNVVLSNGAAFPLLDSNNTVKPFYGNSSEGKNPANQREYNLKMLDEPGAFITWRVEHLAAGYIVGQGVTQIASILTSTSMVRSHAKPDKLNPPYANDVLDIGLPS